ncbi:hypothetical protein SAMN05216360_12915 [Methylobacterium phyllostachyos]|uniref:Uncharacterized protein n=1 Tax=Methylobacterium phyllostachyos TaxID=582672 RepID=A0A1H0KUH7_9HYPH|nr:hypothetical protein [Methylobacterium phyllostachyos]SDO59431.1 hypothetical protein SAMN05216360_12915 [Methylobacterium phyllostachyos]
MTPNLIVRLTALEAARTAVPVLITPEETAEAARRYEVSLHDPEEPDPRAQAYWATATVHQLASNYDAMLKGAPAPWE